MSKVFEVRFEQQAQSATPGRFSIPKPVVDILEITSQTDLFVEVTSHRGVVNRQCRLKSGAEIYGDFDGHFEPGELITVRVIRLGA